MDIDQLKQELVVEIKALAEEISKSNSYIGLLSNEIKFRSLHEKFINLKFLERKHIGLEIFDQPIPLKEEKMEIFSSDEERFEDENVIEFDFKKNYETQEETPIHNDVEQESATENSKTTVIQSKEPETQVENSTEEKIDAHEDVAANETNEFVEEKHETNLSFDPVDDYADLVPEKKFIPKIQLDFNDRIAFLNQLFDGDSESMDLVFKTLNHMETFSDSRSYLHDLKSEMNWHDQEEFLERLEELIAKRFD